MANQDTCSITEPYRPYGAEIKETRPYSPCRAACPAHTDVQAYVGLIAQGRYTEAFEVITAPNPIASVCSMICHHPCERSCRRCGIDEAVAVRPLKRFAIEQAKEYRRNKRKLVAKNKGKSAGIIGSGPSGLTAARDLADLGYSVTIYEKHPVLGGMLAAAIPPYRLPREVLKEDIDDVITRGIEVKAGFEIGKDARLDDLAKKHDAVLVAIGLSLSRSLNIPGVDGPGVLLAIPFLEDIAFNRRPELGKKVLVIGGGNVAMDVARSARRLGVEQVEMVCLENEQEIPAWKWEVEEATEEAVKINYRWGPKAVKRDGEKVLGLEVTKVLSVFDENKRFAPTFDQNTTKLLEADTIIITIGQMSKNDLFNDSAVKLVNGRVEWNKETQKSTGKNIFVAGEVVTGPGSAIAAVASGHRAALAMHLYLQGEAIEGKLPVQEKDSINDMPQEVLAKICKMPREKIKHVAPAERVKTMDHFEIAYTEREALAEAARCRGCGGGAVVDPNKCMACLTCLRVCPYGAPVVKAWSEIRPDYCQACGLCAPECPAQAISMVTYDVKEIRGSMATTVGCVDTNRTEPLIVAFVCTNRLGVHGADLPKNYRPFPVHCTSRVDVLDMLKAFETGADAVAVVRCGNDSCKYIKVEPRVNARVKRGQELIRAIGLEPERIAVLTAAPSGNGGHPYTAVCAEFSETVKKIGFRAK
jgi:NADPH-dependent glutamate synthase beta subunit-like oxidoreductase/coenzyme F420-reducing hydrogenase delta subunit